MEDLFDKDITIINKYVDKEHRTKYKVSYIKGFWSSNNGISINGTQLIKNDELIAEVVVEEKYRNEVERDIRKMNFGGNTIEKIIYVESIKKNLLGKVVRNGE